MEFNGVFPHPLGSHHFFRFPGSWETAGRSSQEGQKYGFVATYCPMFPDGQGLVITHISHTEPRPLETSAVVEMWNDVFSFREL
jgi:hypothetical protein